MRRCLSWLALPALLISLLLVHPEPSAAASGGRIGGGSFRSAPSMPRSYGGGGYGGGGYGGGGAIAAVALASRSCCRSLALVAAACLAFCC